MSAQHPYIPQEDRPTREEEREWFQALARGELTRQDLVSRFMWLIPINVGRFGYRFREDLEQEGVIALYKAVDKFDIGRGLRFSTYAVHWLKQSFHAWLYDHVSTVRIPTYMRKAMARVAKGEACEDLSDECVARAKRLNEQITRHLDELGGFGPGEEDPPKVEELPDLLERAMGNLSRRERSIIRRRFDRGMTYREIGEEEGVSVERIRQIIVRALPKMRTDQLREML